MAQKPTPFQESTAIWATKKLISRRKFVNRFLVADEVGLGKTTVAREVIKRIKKLEKEQGKPVIYVASSLDICAQNRTKLGLDDGDLKKKVDRICLFWSKIKSRKLPPLICLTPGTSLDIGLGRGNIDERAYMAAILYKEKRILKRKLIEVFYKPASKKNFAIKLEETLIGLRKKSLFLPKRMVAARIFKEWRLDIKWMRKRWSRHGFAKKDNEQNLARCVSRMREGMARCIVESLDPCLVILDEFQNYRELLGMKHGELLQPIPRGLLKPRVKTLLLSATPFPAFVSAGDHADPGEHKGKLLGILEFLSGSDSRTDLKEPAIPI
ncbi:MAG: hypothetical protein J0L75_03700 [Spirochaetes bacterium]|nr:hypothetical protein [Spirochaetota bacterium]